MALVDSRSIALRARVEQEAQVYRALEASEPISFTAVRDILNTCDTLTAMDTGHRAADQLSRLIGEGILKRLARVYGLPEEKA